MSRRAGFVPARYRGMRAIPTGITRHSVLLPDGLSMAQPNHLLQRTAAGRRSRNRRASWLPSLNLGSLGELPRQGVPDHEDSGFVQEPTITQLLDEIPSPSKEADSTLRVGLGSEDFRCAPKRLRLK